MKGLDIVMVALQPWDFEIGSNARNIAKEFAKGNRVLYVNPPLDWITRIKKRNTEKTQRYLRYVGRKEDGLISVQENIWNLYPDFVSGSINWISIDEIHDALNRRNNSKFAKSIQQAIDKLGFKNVVVFNDNSMFGGLYLKELLKSHRYLYYIRDYLIVQPYFKRHGIRLEPEIMKKADAVVANSTYLSEYASQFNTNSHYVGQGCEVDMFNPDQVTESPEDMENIKGPIIGYVGFLTSMRLNIPLLIQIAERQPKWSIVLVGPEDEEFANSKLHKMPNVHFLGRKGPSLLPQYVKKFDVCINPQSINPLTVGNYPRKIDEYLAMGKPTVATDTKAMEIFKDHTYLGSTPEEYIDAISKALKETDKDVALKRIAFAKSHTWENSVDEIYRVISALKG